MAEGDVADVEGMVKEWLLTEPGVTALVGRRVWLGLPDDYDARRRGPAVVVRLIGAVPDQSVPVVDQRISLEAWAGTKGDAVALVTPLGGAIWNVRRLRLSGGLLEGASLLGYLWEPDYATDPATGRYVLDVSVTTRPLTATDS